LVQVAFSGAHQLYPGGATGLDWAAPDDGNTSATGNDSSPMINEVGLFSIRMSYLLFFLDCGAQTCVLASASPKEQTLPVRLAHTLFSRLRGLRSRPFLKIQSVSSVLTG
jgi:hypothetical protein